MTTSAATALTDSWLERARALEPLVRQYRDDGERERTLPTPIFTALREAGLFHLWIPRHLGGAELPLDQVVAILEEVGRQDGAVGWSLAIGLESGLASSYLPPKAGSAIYAVAPKPVIAGSVLPRGRAVAVDGGYEVSGRWPLASGCLHADWLTGNCIVFDGDAPRLDPTGAPSPRLFFWPARPNHILDTWVSTGLRGTGSHDIQADHLFVPQTHQCAFSDPVPHLGAMFQVGIYNFVGATIAAVALGIARGALDEFGALAQEKVPARNTLLLAQQPLIQERFATAEALVRAGRALLMEAVGDISAAVARGEGVPPRLRAMKDLASGHAARNAATAVDLVFQAAGTTSIYASSRLDRCFRDVHTLNQHFGVGLQRTVAAGELLLQGYAIDGNRPG